MASKQIYSDDVSSKPQDVKMDTSLSDSTSICVVNKENKSAKMPSETPICYECNKTFPTFGEVILHLKLIHNACAFKDCSKLSNFKLHSSVCANRGFGCAICSKKFQEKHSLLTHFYEHIDAALYACEVCRKGFQQRKDLQKHFFQVHNKFLSIPVTPSLNKTVYQKCQNCSNYFKLFAEFEEHVSSCTTLIYACCICKVSFTSVSELESHKNAEHKNNQVLKGNKALNQGKHYFCGLCYLGFYKGSVLKEHVMAHKIETRHICDVCHVTFMCDSDLQTHYLQHIEEHYVLYDVVEQHSCKNCHKTFKTLKDLNDHSLYKNCKCMSKNSKKVLATACNNVLESINNANNIKSNASMVIPDIPVYVLKVGEDLLNCDDSECIVVMDLTSYFILQQGLCASENRMPDVKNSEVYTENEYPETSAIESYMVSILTPCNEDDMQIPEKVLDGTKKYLAINPETPSAETILLNINECDNDREFAGDVSDKAEFEFFVYDNNGKIVDLSSDSSKVIIEENKMSFDDSNYVADLSIDSNKAIIHKKSMLYDDSNNIADLSSNSNKVHTKKILLDIEDEDYLKNQDNINKELLIENEDALDVSGIYICNICKQVFSSKTSLCLHVKESHTGYDCYQCGDSFTCEEELKNHEKIHLNLFQCNLCEISYPKESLLINHKETIHRKWSFNCNLCNKKYDSKDEYDIHMVFHKGDNPRNCEECGKMYANVSTYLKHKATHVSKIPSEKLVCTICDKVFPEQSALKSHLRTHIRKSPYNFECPKCKMYFPPNMLSKHIESHLDAVSS